MAIDSRYTAEDLEKAGRILERESLIIPPEVIRFMVAAGVEKIKAVEG